MTDRCVDKPSHLFHEALYGETMGNERQASEMCCDHVDADMLTSIDLVFELGGSSVEPLHPLYSFHESSKDKIR